MEESDDIGS